MGFHRRNIGLTRINALLWLAALVLIACAALKLQPKPPPATSSLDQRITEINLDGMPLDQAVEETGKAAGVKVLFDRRAILADRTRMPRVYLHLRNVTLGVALGQLPLRNCVLENEVNCVRVTAFDALPAYVRVYDVRDIVERMMASRFGVSLGDGTPALNSTSNNQSQNPQNPPTTSSDPRSPRDEFANTMAEALFDPDGRQPPHIEWTKAGLLILHGPRQTHDAFETFLRRMRESDRAFPWTPRD